MGRAEDPMLVGRTHRRRLIVVLAVALVGCGGEEAMEGNLQYLGGVNWVSASPTVVQKVAQVPPDADFIEFQVALINALSSVLFTDGAGNPWMQVAADVNLMPGERVRIDCRTQRGQALNLNTGAGPTQIVATVGFYRIVER